MGWDGFQTLRSGQKKDEDDKECCDEEGDEFPASTEMGDNGKRETQCDSKGFFPGTGVRQGESVELAEPESRGCQNEKKKPHPLAEDDDQNDHRRADQTCEYSLENRLSPLCFPWSEPTGLSPRTRIQMICSLVRPNRLSLD